jgi:two-component system chemotaxis response regulator CheB
MPVANASQYRRIRAVITAGSSVAAGQVARELSNDASLEICTAATAATLKQQITAFHPVVVLLDTAIAGDRTPLLVRDLIQQSNLPILIRTDSSESNPAMLLDCIEAGALGISNKPACAAELAQAMPSLIWSLKAAAGAVMTNLNSLRSMNWPGASNRDGKAILAIGAGMGGANTLGKVLTQLPNDAPGAVVIAPIPAQVISNWAQRVGQRCQVKVTPAREGEKIQRGRVYVAPGNGHLLLRNNGSDWTIQIKDGPAVFHQKPSIEMLFNSIADTAAPLAVGVLLGAAGVDGIAGLLQLRKAGGRTLAESPATSLFSELPNRAVQCGAAETSAPANELATKMLELATTHQLPQAA